MDFTYNGRHSSEFPIGCVIKKWPTLPQTTVNKYSVGGRHGTLRYPGYAYGERTLSVQLYLLDDDLLDDPEMLTLAMEIAAWLAPGQRRKLCFDALPEHFFLAEIEKSAELSDDWANGKLEVTFVLQPFLYCQRESRASLTLTAGASQQMAFPIGGDFDAPLLIDVTASSALTSLSILCGEQRFAADGLAMAAGDTLHADAPLENGEILTFTVRDAPHMDLLDSTGDIPLMLSPHARNLLTITADGACSVTIRATGRCL